MSAPGSVRALRGAGRMAAWRAHAYAPAAAELRLEAARVPPLRAPDHVLVRVHTASINPLDVAMLDGYGARVLNALRDATGAEGVEFPLVCGRDFAGTVARAGPAARVRAGQRVWGVVPPHLAGAHADYVVTRAACVGAAPGALGAAAGGALYAALSASAALRAAGLGGAAGGAAPGARVLLLGLGGVGHAALQLLVAKGARVVVGCAAEQGEVALRLGAEAALDRHAPDYDRLLEDAGPYEVVLDCAGLGGGEAGARRWRFARYVTLTTPLLRETDARGLLPGVAVAAGHLLSQSAGAAGAAAGAAGCPAPVRWAYFTPSAADIEALRCLADQGRVERVFAWWDARAAYERAARGAARGKLLLDFCADPPAA